MTNVADTLHKLAINAEHRAVEIAAIAATKDLPEGLANRLTVILAVASMEGLAYQLKDAIYEISRSEGGERRSLSDEFPYILAGSDTKTVIDDNGKLKDRPARHRSQAHVLFCLRYAIFYYDLTMDPFEITEWPKVKPTFKVRDRVIHPRSEEDLAVTEAERNDALKSFIWFKSCLKSIDDGKSELSPEQMARLEDRAQRLAKIRARKSTRQK